MLAGQDSEAAHLNSLKRALESQISMSHLVPLLEFNPQAHKHSEDLEHALSHELSDRVRMAVHLEPRSDKLRPAERQSRSTLKVSDVLSKLRQAANTRVQDVLVTDDGLVVTLEREFPGEMSLRETHEMMTDLERDLKLRVPDIVRVHVDPEILHTKVQA
jgi:divalent metal cation (Fe/Co/Zn/Cd) transporter